MRRRPNRASRAEGVGGELRTKPSWGVIGKRAGSRFWRSLEPSAPTPSFPQLAPRLLANDNRCAHTSARGNMRVRTCTCVWV